MLVNHLRANGTFARTYCATVPFAQNPTRYPLHIVTSDAFAAEKRRTMQAFGAHVEIVPGPRGITPDLIPRRQARAAHRCVPEISVLTERGSVERAVELALIRSGQESRPFTRHEDQNRTLRFP